MKTLTLILGLTLISFNSTAIPAAAALAAALKAEDARHFTKAEQLLSNITEKNDEVYCHLARVQYRAGNFERASETLEILHKAAPDHAEGYYLSGLVNLALLGEVSIFRKIGVAAKALAAWEAAVQSDPAHIDARYAIFAFYANAPGIAGGDLDQAKLMAVELESMDPGYGAMAKGLLFSKEGNPEAAEKALIRAAKQLGRAGPHFALAQFYLENERFAEAVAEVEKYQQKEKRWWDADPAVTHLVMAQAKNGLGETEAARNELETGLKRNPSKRVRGMLQKALKDL